MWPDLIPLKDKEGQDTGIDLLLLDSEGLQSKSRSFDFDVKLFALNILLSSTLLFNQIGNISDQAFENLSMIEMMTNQIKLKNSNETGLEFNSVFPELCWVLRDFEMEFKSLTPESYLEQCLEQETAFSDEGRQKN